jgi:hypothetical protein
MDVLSAVKGGAKQGGAMKSKKGWEIPFWWKISPQLKAIGGCAEEAG